MRELVAGGGADAENGRIIDHIIDFAVNEDPSLEPLVFGEGERVEVVEHGKVVEVAECLSRLPRLKRIDLGTRWIRAIRTAGSTQQDHWVQQYKRGDGTAIAFLACPLSPEDRLERRKRLLMGTEVYRQETGARLALGIATEASPTAGRSYDFVYIGSRQ